MRTQKLPSEVKSFLDKISTSTKVQFSEKIGSVTLFGRGIIFKRIPTTVTVSSLPVDVNVARHYKSCMIAGDVFKCFSSQGQCIDSFFKTRNDDYGSIRHILVESNKVWIIANLFKIEKKKSTISTDHLQVIRKENEPILIPATDIVEKCVWIQTLKHSIVSTFPNNIERY